MKDEQSTVKFILVIPCERDNSINPSWELLLSVVKSGSTPVSYEVLLLCGSCFPGLGPVLTIKVPYGCTGHDYFSLLTLFSPSSLSVTKLINRLIYQGVSGTINKRGIRFKSLYSNFRYILSLYCTKYKIYLVKSRTHTIR